MQQTTLLNTLRQKKPLSTISKFISNSDLCRLSMTAKAYHKLLSCRIKRQIVRLSEYVDCKVSVLDKSNKQTKSKLQEGITITREENCVIVKTNVWKCPVEIFKTRLLWHAVKDYKLASQHLNEKVATGIYTIFVHNTRGNQVFLINRSLIDRSLDYAKGGFEEEDSKEMYEKLYEGKELTDNYDFTSQASMRQRQQQLLSNMNKKQQEVELIEKQALELGVEALRTFKRISIILCFGGYFSMGVFENQRCVLHKSDHKYVCRKKAGGRQLNKDKCTGKSIKSMGSQIRRDQEKHHQENVSEILEENFAELEKSDVIFFQAPGLNRIMLIEQNEALNKLKDKLRSVCLTAKKANYTEVERLYEEITKVYLLKLDTPQQKKEDL